MGYIFESYVCVFQRLQFCVQFDINVWLDWASPCPDDHSMRGSTHYESNWLLGSIVNRRQRTCAMWHVTSARGHVTCDRWQIIGDRWEVKVTHDMWHMKGDKEQWQVTGYRLQVTKYLYTDWLVFTYIWKKKKMSLNGSNNISSIMF